MLRKVMVPGRPTGTPCASMRPISPPLASAAVASASTMTALEGGRTGDAVDEDGRGTGRVGDLADVDKVPLVLLGDVGRGEGRLGLLRPEHPHDLDVLLALCATSAEQPK